MNEPVQQSQCTCDTAPKLVFSCSGAADVGQLTDLAARRLSREGDAKMFCLAGIGGRVSGIMASAQAAAALLALDGCPLDCARKTLEEAGFTKFSHLRLSDMGITKGQSPVTDERLAAVTQRARELIACA